MTRVFDSPRPDQLQYKQNAMGAEDLISLAACVGASDADLIYIARLVAGDDHLLDIHDLTPEGALEAASYLRTLAASERWLENLV
jgi:hypothetical protein